mgnify:CR=1 FL=1
MQDSNIFFAPAKLNIFLKVLGRRLDGYHLIRSGITFIDLFDKITINEIFSETSITYSGLYSPLGGNYDDCIIKKTIKFLNINKNFNIFIEKNIPVQGGLGSASTNAATIIKAFEKMNIIPKKEPKFYSSLGSDIPCFLFNKNCLVTGIGENIYSHHFPKYYFLIIKPLFNNSTKDIYEKLNINKYPLNQKLLIDKIESKDNNIGNDFEDIIISTNPEFNLLFKFLKKLDNIIFTRMTGTGSCLYAVFKKKKYALDAQIKFKKEFKDLWSCISENNF